jgi:paraquat-inducible protein B
VIDVRVVPDLEDARVTMPVLIEIDPRRIQWNGDQLGMEELFLDLIDQGLRAQIKVQSYITGQRMIELDLMPERSGKLARRSHKYPEIPTVPSRMQQISKTVEELPLEELLTKLASAVEGVEETVNSPQLTEGLRALNDSAQVARDLLNSLERDVPGVAKQLNATLGEARGVMQRTDRRLDRLAGNLKQASRAAEKAFIQMEGTLSLERGAGAELASGLKQTLDAARSAFERVEASLAAFEEVAGKSEFRYELKNTLKEISSAARSVRSLAQFLERNPDAVWRGKSGR